VSELLEQFQRLAMCLVCATLVKNRSLTIPCAPCGAMK
jgi:hypothetical protein